MEKERGIKITNVDKDTKQNGVLGGVICYGCGKSGADDKLEVIDYCPCCYGAGCVDCKYSGHQWQKVDVHKSCI
jgi:hypothetical protein